VNGWSATGVKAEGRTEETSEVADALLFRLGIVELQKKRGEEISVKWGSDRERESHR